MNPELSDSGLWALGERLGNANTPWKERVRIAEQLGQVGTQAANALFHAQTVSAIDHESWRSVQELIESALSSMGESVIEPLTKRIEDNPTLHLLPKVLVKVGGKRVLNTIINAFQRVSSIPSRRILGIFPYDEHRPARLLYIYLLSQFDTPEVITTLKEAISSDRSRQVCVAAQEALATIRNRRM